MAQRKNSNEQVEVTKASSQDELSRFRLGELGVTGLSMFNGVTYEEVKRELNFPESVNTYKLMSYHSSINAPINLFTNMVAKAPLRILPVKDATEEEKRQAEIVEEMFNDMEHSLEDFIRSGMTAMIYGFAPIEKVFRKRTYASGSVYNDGLIGIKKLPLRSQKSIKKFIFDDSGNEILGVSQTVAGTDPYNRFNKRVNQDINIPRNKFMLITFGDDRSNPYGTSPLRDVYSSWKYIQAIEELEAQSVVKDLNGLPVLTVPIQYMSADASVDQKAQLEVFKNIIRNLQQGNQSGVILPSAVDPESKKELFSIELLSQDGKKNFNLTEIKEYYRTSIFIGLNADILLMGSTNSGSFALGSIKNTLAGNAAESYLDRIIAEVNNDLIRQIYELNGWDISRRCRLDHEGVDTESMDEVGKFIQRCAAVGMLTKDIDTVNYIRNTIGLDPLPDDADLDELLGDNTSRSSEGMQEGLNSGTGSADGSSGNSSDVNADNAA